MPARKRAWSSASRTFIGVSPSSVPSIVGDRQADVHCGAPLRAGLDLEATADSLGALAHRLQAEVGPAGAHPPLRVEAAAVVRDGQQQLSIASGEADGSAVGLGMVADVGERLLH